MLLTGLIEKGMKTFDFGRLYLASLPLRQEAVKEPVYFVLHKWILCELLVEWVVCLPDWEGIASDDGNVI